MRTCYDICVVGAGTIGSAAARHVTQIVPDAKVLLIGPFERQDRLSIDIHGAYYDEGRITRTVDRDSTWGVLDRRSVARYRQVEQPSGIRFYEEVGYVFVGTKDGADMRSMKKTSTELEVPFTALSTEQLSAMMPYFRFRPTDAGIHAQNDAGYVNPRELVDAQRRLAELNGCQIIDDVVKNISAPSGAEEYYHLEADCGRVYYSKKVLLATGAFTACRNLLPAGLQPDIELHGETVILIEVDGEQQARLAAMPSMAVMHPELPPGGSRGLQAYILPPIRYPDGKTYLKLGHGKTHMVRIQTPADIHHWYNMRDIGEQERYVYDMARTFFPDLPMKKYKYDHCVTAHTPHGYPFIDLLTPSLGVVLAGNGQGAKSADELGRIAAKMIVKGAWDSDLPREKFRFINRSPRQPTSKL